MFIAAIVGGGGALLGAYSSRKAGKDAAAAQAKAMQGDPRISGILHGNAQTGQKGLLEHYQGMLSTPQNTALEQYGQANLNYLSAAPGDMQGIRNTANGLLGGNAAPRAEASAIGGAAWAKGNMVNAPNQNSLDLKGAYDGFINGPRGNNPFLTSAINGGMKQSQNMFDQMQDSATANLRENILPGIGQSSVLAGQYGGSRQGIAEGRAIGDFAKAQQQAINQFGQNNTNAAVGAQANAYESDSNRALSATQGLGAQQYGVAQQDAATRNAAEFMNVGLANQNFANNAQMQQQTNLANLGAEQQQNSLNQNGRLAGAGLLSGQLGAAYGIGQNQQNYGIDQATRVNNLMQPYLSQNPTQPVAPTSNTAGGLLGGAMAGLGLYNQFKNMGGGTASNPMNTGNPMSGNPAIGGYGTGAAAGGGGTYYDGTQWVKG